MSRFLQALHSGQVLLMDGAMGTELQRADIRAGECYELWNLTHPDKVRAVHERYAAAGARCFLTHTFQSNPPALARHGLDDKLEAINHAAVELARSLAGPDRFVLSDIGPIEAASETEEMTRFDNVFASLSGADALLLDTRPHALHALYAQRAKEAHANPRGIPVLLSIAYRHHPTKGMAPFLPEPENVAKLAEFCGIDALGVNCGRDIGLDDVIEIIRRYRAVTRLPLFARPNAGAPTRGDKGWIYPETPEKMASRLPELLEAGVCMVGGCCGTTPEHIAAFRPIVEQWNRVAIAD
jgi:5-methyltetrahydrofolate--homocysteine methyltransferase